MLSRRGPGPALPCAAPPGAPGHATPASPPCRGDTAPRHHRSGTGAQRGNDRFALRRKWCTQFDGPRVEDGVEPVALPGCLPWEGAAASAQRGLVVPGASAPCEHRQRGDGAVPAGGQLAGGGEETQRYGRVPIPRVPGRDEHSMRGARRARHRTAFGVAQQRVIGDRGRAPAPSGTLTGVNDHEAAARLARLHPHAGGRFSRNAAMPSAASGEANSARDRSPVRVNASARAINVCTRRGTGLTAGAPPGRPPPGRAATRPGSWPADPAGCWPRPPRPAGR